MSYIAIDRAYIENRIAELEQHPVFQDIENKIKTHNSISGQQQTLRNLAQARIDELEDILSQGIEILVEEKWNNIVAEDTWVYDFLVKEYPNGVIIKPK